MNPPSVPPIVPIAVDLTYEIRDNQFWYTDCAFAGLLTGAATITLNVAGLGVRVLTRAAQGNNPQPTTSFTLPSAADRDWWKQHNRQRVRVELLAIGGSVPPAAPVAVPPAAPPPPTPALAPTPPAAAPSNRPHNAPGTPSELTGSVLCIGLDVAWFGGSQDKRDSQYDCLTWAILDRRANQPFTLTCHLERVALQGRDPDATQLLQAIDALLQRHSAVERIVFAVDAPIQAAPRPNLPTRASLPPAGTIQRRACEDHLSQMRQAIDALAGGAGDWYPNIQPGAPLAPRVMCLLAGLQLQHRGFHLWTQANRVEPRLVIECFPAEAIWAMKRLNRYDASRTADQVKCYKAQEGNLLSAQQVAELTHTVLDGFAVDSGHAGIWGILVEHAIEWMCADATWRRAPGQYRGGKLLDDVVDSMICLATALSYTHNRHHVWQDPNRLDDGHIIGPGHLDHR